MFTLERDQLGQRAPGDPTTPGLVRGLDHVRNPQLNKVRDSWAIDIVRGVVLCFLVYNLALAAGVDGYLFFY